VDGTGSEPCAAVGSSVLTSPDVLSYQELSLPALC